MFPTPNEFDETFIMILRGFFDESGKFKDRSIVAFCGFITEKANLEPFDRQWRGLLRKNGLDCLSMKDALNHKHKLSSKNTRTGIAARIKDLTPFAECIRHHFEFGVGSAVDVKNFNLLKSHIRARLRNDPYYVAFERTMHDAVRHLAKANDLVSVAMDDEQHYSPRCYALLTQMKREQPSIQKKIVSIMFANDLYYPALQAADMLSSLTRLEAQWVFADQEYEYRELYQVLVAEAVASQQMVYKPRGTPKTGHAWTPENRPTG